MIRPNLKQFAQKVRRPKITRPNFTQKLTRPNFTQKVRRPNENLTQRLQDRISFLCCLNKYTL